jgi:hypothetical protein
MYYLEEELVEEDRHANILHRSGWYIDAAAGGIAMVDGVGVGELERNDLGPTCRDDFDFDGGTT